MNSPVAPGEVAMGTKASTVVRVEASNGTSRYRTERRTACPALSPERSRCCTSSTTTMALSISSPRAITRPVADIWCRGTSSTRIQPNTIRADRGRATPTTRAALPPSISTDTATTSSEPVIRLPITPSRRSWT